MCIQPKVYTDEFCSISCSQAVQPLGTILREEWHASGADPGHKVLRSLSVTHAYDHVRPMLKPLHPHAQCMVHTKPCYEREDSWSSVLCCGSAFAVMSMWAGNTVLSLLALFNCSGQEWESNYITRTRKFGLRILCVKSRIVQWLLEQRD